MEWGMWEEQLFKESTVIGERDQRAPMRKLKTTGNHQDMVAGHNNQNGGNFT
jgi:hypothetical protein